MRFVVVVVGDVGELFLISVVKVIKVCNSHCRNVILHYLSGFHIGILISRFILIKIGILVHS